MSAATSSGLGDVPQSEAADVGSRRSGRPRSSQNLKDPSDSSSSETPRLTVVPEGSAATERLAERRWPPATARRGFGMALLGLASAGRFVSGDEQPISASAADAASAQPVLDVFLGALDIVLELGEVISFSISGRLSPLISRALQPAREPAIGISRELRLVLDSVTGPLAVRGARLRSDAQKDASSAVAAVLPDSMDLIMENVNLTDLAVTHMEFERVLTAAFEQVDMEALMIENVDLGRIVEASLSQVDLTELALKELDLERVVLATLERVDIFALARDQVDPVRVAAYLRENVDVAEVLKNAPGDAVRGVFDTMGKMVPGRTREGVRPDALRSGGSGIEP